MKVSHEIYVHASKYNEEGYTVFDFDASNNGYILINKQTVELDIPDDFDPTATQIAMLNKQIEKAEKEFSDRVTKLKEEISKLQAISYEVPV